MSKRIGDIYSARFYDREARKQLTKASEFWKRAARARTAESRKRWLQQAEKERFKAMVFLEKANAAC